MKTQTIAPTFTRNAAKSFMRRIAADHRDRQTGEINNTALAEACAAHFGVDGLKGPLDDPDHWIWEVALEIE